MIKIVHILSLMNFGGMEQLVFNLCRYTKNTEPFVLAIRDGVIVEDFQKANIPMFVMPTIDNPYEKYRRALEILRGADIINVHCLYRDPIIAMFVWLVKESGIPYLFTLHWQSRLPLLDCVICCTAQCIKAMQAKGNKCVVIPNGIDLTKFVHKQTKKKNTNKVIITLISYPQKCSPYFWFAMKDVLEANPNVELWIVGDKPWTAKQIKSLGIRRDIPDILAQTDIFVYAPYPKIGGIENVVLEAMAMGVPSVLSDVECVRETITNGKEGLLTPYGDRKAFAEAVNVLINNEDYRKELGHNALEKAKKFNVVDVVLQHDELYHSLLTSGWKTNSECDLHFF